MVYTCFPSAHKNGDDWGMVLRKCVKIDPTIVNMYCHWFIDPVIINQTVLLHGG